MGSENIITLYPDSPDAGDPHCQCSYCHMRIEEDECPARGFVEVETCPVHKTKQKMEWRMHQRCMAECLELGYLVTATT